MTEIGWPAVTITGAAGQGGFVVLCEHAASFIPPALDHLGLAEAVRESHIAWDPGALLVAQRLAQQLTAPLVAGALSRLVYDCNRPLEAPDCIPERSEVHEVPGNHGLTPTQRQARFDQVHRPFHAAVDTLLDAPRAVPPVLVTVHTFTPIYHGQKRTVELGYLFHADGRVAEAAVAQEARTGKYQAAVNAPYDASDGVTYSLRKHADTRGLASVMIEIRNDLVDTAAKAEAMADHLVETLSAATRSLHSEQRAAL